MAIKHFLDSDRIRLLTILFLLWFGFLVRLLELELPSIWIDEIISSQRIQFPLTTMLNRLPLNQVPAYYGVLNIWGRLLGPSVLVLRLFSVFCGTLVISLMYQLGKILFNAETGVFTAAVVTFSPFLVFYSRMARPYAFLWTLILIATYCYILALRKGRLFFWIGFVLASIVAMYTHLTAISVLIFFDLFFIALWNRYKIRLKSWLVVQLLLLLAFLPLAFNLLSLVIRGGNQLLTSRQPLGFWGLANVFVVWNLGHAITTTRLVFLFTLITFGVLALASIMEIRRGSFQSKDALSVSNLASWFRPELKIDIPEIFLVGFLLLPLGLAIVVALLNPARLPFTPRTLSVVSIAYYILLVRGAMRLRPHILQWILIVVCGLSMIWALTVIRGQSAGIDWRRIAGHIENNLHSDDVVFVNPGEYLPAFNMYFDGDAPTESRISTAGDPINTPNIHEKLATVSGSERVWMVTLNDSVFDPENQINSWLSQYCVVQEHSVLIKNHALLRLYGDCTWE